MIVALLLMFLIAGLEESQQTNTTDLTQETTNQTSTVSTNASNVTLSLEKSLMEAELQDNDTHVITEDEDAFMGQDKVLTDRGCHHELLKLYMHDLCGEIFHSQMLALGSENWCHLDSVTSAYSNVTACVEKLCGFVSCFYPNTDTQDFFLSVHAFYFGDCDKDELTFEEAPHWLVMVLTLIPVSLIPILVNLVVWKSKVQE